MMICNNCLDGFQIEKDDIRHETHEGLEIQYFRCPSCGYPYVILAEDEKLKDLEAARKVIGKKARAAYVGHYRKKSFAALAIEELKLKKEAMELASKLKHRAEHLLKEVDHGKV